MATAGPSYPGTVTTSNAVAPYDDIDWTNASNVGASDTADASITNMANAAYSYRLIGTNFGFAIKAGSTINGITVSVEENCASGSAVDGLVQLTFGGAAVGANKASVSAWSSSAYAVVSYGASTDTWSWAEVAATSINDSTFGVLFSVQSTAANSDI